MNVSTILRRVLPPRTCGRTVVTSTRSGKVCVVGSGPAGFYTAQQLLKANSSLEVDIYDKLPVPFGLVRYGVAPDHPDVKNVINTFTQTAKNPRCRFVGNVEIGKDLSLQDLQRSYNAVVLSYGASEDRKLGIPGEDFRNVISARRFVGWYNGLPDDKGLDVDLECTDTAVVIGQGNVAVDVARILLTDVDVLRKTDITDYALDKLSRSKIRNVRLVGRRGPLQVAFTIKEFRELVKLQNCQTILERKYFENLDDFLKTAKRPRKRLTELLIKTASEKIVACERQLFVDFLRSPLEIKGEHGSVNSVKFALNRLEGALGEDQKPVQTSNTELISTGLVLTSIGYKSVKLEDSIPFDDRKGVILNSHGRVENCPGLYCSGWVKTGPVGVILSTMADGFSVGKSIIQDLENGLLGEEKKGFSDISEVLEKKKVRVVSWSDWEKIDEVESSRSRDGSPREKITDVTEFLGIIN